MFKNSKILEFYIELMFAGLFCNIIPINKRFKRYRREYTIEIVRFFLICRIIHMRHSVGGNVNSALPRFASVVKTFNLRYSLLILSVFVTMSPVFLTG